MQPSNIVPASRRRSASVTAAHGHPTRTDRQGDAPAHPAPSSIQSDVSLLGNPITMAEIASLLDRASQPTFQQAQSPHGPLYYPDGVPAPATQPRTRTEADARAVERISALREELRIESTRLGSWINRIPDPPTLTWDHAVRAAQRDRGARRASRANAERIRITAIEHRRSTSPRVDQTASNVAQAEVQPPRQGLPPTNLRTTAPAPVVVRSTPLSPASTVTPDHILSSAFGTTDEGLSDSLGSESPPAARHIPLPEVLTPDSLPNRLPDVEETPGSILVQTETTETVHRPQIVHVRVTTPDPEEVVLNLPSEWGESTFFDMSPSTSTAPGPRARPQINSALTTRGQRVNARLDSDAQAQTFTVQSTEAHPPLDFDESSFLSSFPTLRELFDDIATLPQESARPQTNVPARSDGAGVNLEYRRAIQQARREGLLGVSEVPYIGATIESPMDREINAMRRAEGEHLRSLAQDIVRSNPHRAASSEVAGTANDGPDMTAGRRRLREAIRAQRMRDERAMNNRGSVETPSRDQIAQVPRARYSPTAAATIATSARTDTDSTASNSTTGSTSLHRETSPGTQVDARMSFDQLSERFDDRTAAVRASLDRSRARMRELAELRRDYAELQRRNPEAVRARGEVDLVQVLQNGENAREARVAVERAMQGQDEGVYEGSGQRREGSQRRSRRPEDEGKDEGQYTTLMG